MGHTINFKTRKHFKDKKSHYVPEDEWTIFENTHEAIIDQETFDLAQKVRSKVRRYPDGWGDVAPLTGLLYCADCGGKMYVHRFNNGKRISQYTLLYEQEQKKQVQKAPKQKKQDKVPYETHPADRLRQCVFGGSSNTMDFLPLDRSGNRRFLPIMVHPENAEVHILEDEAASRAFIDMMWAEAMFIYQNFPLKLTLSKDMDKELKELQKQFMPEDTKAGLIQSFLDNFKGTQVCSKLIYAEALNHPFDEPKQWEIREINEIMNNSIEGWKPFSNPRSFAKYGRQRGWERIPPPDNEPSATGSNLTDGFRELTEEEARQMELPF